MYECSVIYTLCLVCTTSADYMWGRYGLDRIIGRCGVVLLRLISCCGTLRVFSRSDVVRRVFFNACVGANDALDIGLYISRCSSVRSELTRNAVRVIRHGVGFSDAGFQTRCVSLSLHRSRMCTGRLLVLHRCWINLDNRYSLDSPRRWNRFSNLWSRRQRFRHHRLLLLLLLLSILALLLVDQDLDSHLPTQKACIPYPLLHHFFLPLNHPLQPCAHYPFEIQHPFQVQPLHFILTPLRHCLEEPFCI